MRATLHTTGVMGCILTGYLHFHCNKNLKKKLVQTLAHSEHCDTFLYLKKKDIPKDNYCQVCENFNVKKNSLVSC